MIKEHFISIRPIVLGISLALVTSQTHGQFVDNFDGPSIENWFFFTGDGDAKMDFTQHEGFARIDVDATQDAFNVWWAIIKCDVSSSLDLSLLEDPNYELRVEARVRLSDAPRRINFMINTQRTVDYHEHLREYDIADTSDWHTISMTTKNLDAKPGDSLFVQLGVTDWGSGTCHVDVDYYKAEIVDIRDVLPDVGEPLIYHPPLPFFQDFKYHLPVSHDSVIHSKFADVNFNNWTFHTGAQSTPVLTVSENQWPILRWDFADHLGGEVTSAGVLELITQSVASGGKYDDAFGHDLGMEFGKVRIVEILGGDPSWDQVTVTWNSLMQGASPAKVFNSQMIFDTELNTEIGGKTYISISRPVMQRLLNGTTKGLVIQPLGAINASFFSSEASRQTSPKLHFNLKE